MRWRLPSFCQRRSMWQAKPPTKPAAYALLARAYLCMGAYDQAGKYADSCLQLHNSLIAYSDINPSVSQPFSLDNPEIIYQSNILNCVMVVSINQSTIVDSALYDLYDTNDLRKVLYLN